MKIKQVVEWYKGFCIELTQTNEFVYTLDLSNNEFIRSHAYKTIDECRRLIDAEMSSNLPKLGM